MRTPPRRGQGGTQGRNLLARTLAALEIAYDGPLPGIVRVLELVPSLEHLVVENLQLVEERVEFTTMVVVNVHAASKISKTVFFMFLLLQQIW